MAVGGGLRLRVGLNVVEERDSCGPCWELNV